MTKPVFLDLPSQAPEIHRSSPFEYMQTAETVAVVANVSKPIPAVRPWVTKVGTMVLKPLLPQWMSSPEPSSKQRTSR